MMPSMFAVAGVYWRIFRVAIPANTDPRGPLHLRTLMHGSPDFEDLDRGFITQPDLILAAKLVDMDGDINLYGPGNDIKTPKTSVPRAWPASKGDWTENCTQLMNTTWAQAQGVAAVNAKLIVYLRGMPIKTNQ